MQSADGAVHLLPALPDAWPTGSVGGLRARGGFEIVRAEWKEGRIVKLVVRSTIGGNLRLRVPNSLKFMDGGALKAASGENPNPFFRTDVVPPHIVSPVAVVTAPVLKPTMLYDLPTVAGKTYTLVDADAMK